jgi:hypothetical protein
LQAEVAELMAKAEAAHQADVRDGMSILEELARREARLAAIARAKATIEARAKERHARERADYEAKLKAHREEAGRPPTAPVIAQTAPSPAAIPVARMDRGGWYFLDDRMRLRVDLVKNGASGVRPQGRHRTRPCLIERMNRGLPRWEFP